MGADFGGETLVDVTYSDGSQSSIDAGQGFSLSGGLMYALVEEQSYDFDLQATIGYKFASITEATNASLDYTRIPLDLLFFYHSKDGSWRLGGGVTYHTGVSLEGSGITAAATTDFDDSLGYIIEMDYITEKYFIGMRITSIDYTSERFNTTVGAESVGIQVGLFTGGTE